MNRREVEGVVARICTLWNVKDDSGAMADAWFRFIHDLNVDEVHEVIDDLAVRSDHRFAPRAGEMRRLVMSRFDPNITPPPDPMQAWSDYQSRQRAANNGDRMPEVHDTVYETALRLRGQHLVTNGDRELFLSTFAQVVSDWEAEMFKVHR